MAPREQANISQSEAQARGLPHFFTGKPCGRGHVAPRHVVSRHCTECQRVYGQVFYHADLEHWMDPAERAWREANPELAREAVRLLMRARERLSL